MSGAPPAKAAKLGRADTPLHLREDRGERQRKSNDRDGAALYRRDIDACAQRADVEGALAVFQRAKSQDFALQIHSYNVLLHLCAGGNQAEDSTKRVFSPQSAEVFEHMAEKGVAPVEMTFTALARIAAASGEPQKAYDLARCACLAKCMRDKGLVARLRTFTPAVTGFCDAHDIANALIVEADIRASGIALSEVEYIALLRCFSVIKSHADEAWSLLRRMRDDIRLASQELLAAIRGWFESHGTAWAVSDAAVDEDGQHKTDAGIRLQAVDLTDAEREELAGAIATLSRARERAQDFDGFVEWSERHGPFDTIVDGANVGMFNQNFEDARFNFHQLERLMAHLREERGAEAKPALLVLHQRRVKGGAANAPSAGNLIRQWRNNHELFTTPAGSNDDWYWLYAAVNAGASGILITNDELRDHVFQMLPAPRLFYKWKERHQVRFSFSPGGVVLQRPPLYTTCIQEAADSAWWMFPCSESEEWLCAKRNS